MNLLAKYKIILSLVIVIVLNLTATNSATADSIARQLQRHVPKIVDYLNANNLRTVGVLKFRVKKPGQKISDSVGPLTSLLADRLEIGLILGNPFDKARQLNIIEDASSQAASIPGAEHVTVAGQSTFFGPKFEMSIAGEKKEADAFLTGVVQVHDDNRHVTVGILCFDRNGGGLVKACGVFEADLDASSLSEMGESFTLRGIFDGGTTQQTFKEDQKQKQQQVLSAAAKVKTQLTSFPLSDPSSPVTLEIRYDGRLKNVEMRDGQAFVAEPGEGQKVELFLVRNPSAKGRVAVVLKVNGENTLSRQTFSDIECSKWVLSPEYTRTAVKGFQVDGNQTEKFTVLSRAEGARQAVNYGRNYGQIQMTVFKELTGPKPLATFDEDEEDLVAMLRGVRPSEPSRDLSALKGKIRAASKVQPQHRGPMVAGERAENKTRKVKFEADPTPVMAVTITYYKP